MPEAGPSGGDLSSSTSLSRKMRSSSSSSPVFLSALTSIIAVSPPYSSLRSPWAVSCCLARLGLASGLSILFSATTIGVPAACAWLMASTVERHDPVVGGHHQHHDVDRLAPRARAWP